MNKRWLCILFSLLLVIIMTACNAQSESVASEENSTIESSISASSKPENALQAFLASHSEQDMEDLFLMISAAALPNMPDTTDPYPYYGFQNTSQLSSNGLFNFFCLNCDQTKFEEYWNEQDQMYHIPISFVRDTLDDYFKGYQFDPRTITIDAFKYRAEEQAFVAAGFPGFDGRKNGVKIVSTEQTADGTLCLTAKTLDLEDQTKETGASEILVIQLTETGVLFKSYQIIPRKYTDRELFDFSDSLGFKIVNWVGQLPLSSAVINDYFAELQCEFDKNNYGFLQIAVDDGSDIFDNPDWQFDSKKTVIIKEISVIISHYASGQVQASWTKNGYVYCLYMNHGVKDVPEENFFVNQVGLFIEQLELDPEHAG